MVKERNALRTGQEHDEKTQTENIVYSPVMKTEDQSDPEEDLGSLSIDDIINHIEHLKIKDEKKEIFTARGKIKTPQIDERLYPYGNYYKTTDNVQINLPEYKIQQPYLIHTTIMPPTCQHFSTQNVFREKQNHYVAAVDERCRFWMKPKEEFAYYQQIQGHHLLPRKDPYQGIWEEDGRVRKQKTSGNSKSAGNVTLRSIRKLKQTKDLTVADGVVIPFPEEFCSDEDIIDGLPLDLDVDCCPGQMHFSEKAWEDGIPKLDLPACDLMEIFENCPDSHIVSKSEHHGYFPLSPAETIPNYHPSPGRMDEVYNQDSNDKLSSPEHSQDECEIVETTSPYPQMGLSPNGSALGDIEVCSPGELSPGELKNLEQITQHLNDTYTVLDNHMYFDWISCDIDGDSVLHSCMIAEATTDLILLLIVSLQSEGILSSIINLQNQMLRTALFLAVREEKVDIAKSLLDNNADPNIQGKILGINDNYELRSPLHLVAEKGDNSLQMLKILLDCDKTQVDLRSESDRRTALHLALLSHCFDRPERSNVNCSRTIELLIQYDADVELAEDCSSKTPIILAIDTRDYHLVKSFINCVEEEKEKDMIRCILETCTRAGDTPLHIAAGANILKEDKVKLLRLLVNRGANTHTENNIKQLPEDIASRDLWKAAFRC
ncbi:uncharacterized protein LOC117340902 [Pecten maximus]|uniref:uncharacterized protein LOC117340902 n=1 Tax=Pecten maximus TaxID=6579 RepID=UPI001457F149|nr:uncharacterized protein LOC117340902 [Pecten maximus]XP_033758574.1 uncharacterized protein LOC117340902 [Pecten maximus]XP_033758575.1 uncharacterized protein LOC117340902 [Pecten maximus]